MKTKNIALCGLGLGLLFSACSSENAEMNEPEPIQPQVPVDDVAQIVEINLTPEQKSTLNATNKMAFDLFGDMSRSATGSDQICYSPISVLNVLSMMANGATDETVDNITRIFGIPGTSEEVLSVLNNTCADVVSNLPKVSKDVKISFTNSLWHDSSLLPNPDYKTLLEKNFSAQCLNQSPAGLEGQNKINAWVKQYTNGLISKFLESPLYGDIALLNTVYFKGAWKEGFDDKMTKPGDFRNADGSVSSADFMESEVLAPISDSDKWTMVTLPFIDDKFEMSFIMPREEVEMPILTCSEWETLDATKYREDFVLYLPKFEIEYGPDLSGCIDNRFPGSLKNTYFDRMIVGWQNVGFNCLIHKAKIKVDENGCEAAAATLGGILSFPGYDDPKLREIRFDRPFYFVLHEKTTGAVLFLGKVSGF